MVNEKRIRNSSFELLRMFLIFLVMLGHANMWFLGDCYQSEAEHWLRNAVQVVCMPAVNAFVLISGWFGIKSDYKRFFSLVFQLLLCTVPLALCFFVIGRINLFSFEAINKYIFGGNNYWFVIDYIGLVLFAPLLNLVANHTNKQTMKTFFISILVLLVIFDVILRSTVLGVEGGYSLLWFVYLYLLARYMRIYGCNLIVKYKWTIMLLCVILQIILLHYHLIGNRYTNPLILVPAMCLIFIFRDYEFYSKKVNFMASGALMAYMLHMQPCLVDGIRVFLNQLYTKNGYYVYICEVIGMIALLYIVAVIIDRIQARMWRILTYRFF